MTLLQGSKRAAAFESGSSRLGGLQSKERGEMLYEERLEAAERRRLEGNELFKAGQCRDALGKYATSRSVVYLRVACVLKLCILGGMHTHCQDLYVLQKIQTCTNCKKSLTVRAHEEPLWHFDSRRIFPAIAASPTSFVAMSLWGLTCAVASGHTYIFKFRLTATSRSRHECSDIW